MSVFLIMTLFALLALPVFFLFAPHFSAGLMAPTHQREVRELIAGPNVVSFERNMLHLEQLQRKKDVIGKLSNKSTRKPASSHLTITKRLKYAQWPISQIFFHVLEVAVSIVMFLITQPFLGFVLKFFILLTGPIIMRGILNYCVGRRFKKFDRDYPQFLLSIVGLLKTGMSAVNAIEAAASGLDPKSLVRAEVHFMIERMRMGAPEDRSIGSFGETILHPEIELFIQALLLSKRVGGTLSDTLERLAKQVRKRQYFRDSANAAVGLQRASGIMILGILVALEIYIYFTYPQLVVEAWYDPTGWMVWQCAFFAIAFSILWSREITKIRV